MFATTTLRLDHFIDNYPDSAHENIRQNRSEPEEERNGTAEEEAALAATLQEANLTDLAVVKAARVLLGQT